MAATSRVDLAQTGELLKERLLRRLPGEGVVSDAMDGVLLARHDAPVYLKNCFYNPVLAVIVQGRKRSLIGAETYEYGEGQCLIVGIDIPGVVYIPDATPERPFLSVGVTLQPATLAQLVMEMPPLAQARKDSRRGISVADVEPDVLDAFLRLLELLDRPRQIPVLAPMIIREIHYRVLCGVQGPFLRMLHTAGTQTSQIARAIAWMREHYATPLQIDALARQVHMGTSTFHHHFKKVTTLSPLQFYKRLRLHEAKRLMLEEQRNAGDACFAVGYESQTQFTREYKQLFGRTPLRDTRLGAHPAGA